MEHRRHPRQKIFERALFFQLLRDRFRARPSQRLLYSISPGFLSEDTVAKVKVLGKGEAGLAQLEEYIPKVCAFIGILPAGTCAVYCILLNWAAPGVS